MSVEEWHYPETDGWETGSLFSGILSMLDSHHKTLESHERALRIVADTENKAANAINISIWLSVVATAISVFALALEVLT